MPETPARAALIRHLARMRLNARQPRCRIMIKAGRVVWGNAWTAGDIPPWPRRARTEADGKTLVYA